MPSPLEQATAAGVNPVTNPLAALQSMAISRAGQQDQYMEQQQAAQNKRLEELSRMADGSPEADSAEQWGAMAAGAASVPAVYGGFGQMLAAMGANYGKTLGAQDRQNFARHQAVAKMTGDELRALESHNALSGLLKNAAGGNNVNVPGVGLVERGTGRVVVPQSLLPQYTKIYESAYAKAVANRMENPEAYAEATAKAALGNVPEGVMGGRPGVANVTMKGDQPVISEAPAPSAEPGARATGMSYPKVTADEDAAYLADRLDIIRSEKKRYADNPQVLQDLSKQEVAIQRKLAALPSPDNPSGTVLPTATPPALKYADKPKQEMEIETGKETGKAIAKEHEALNQASVASGKLINQLSMMRDLYSNPNIPQGEFGPKIQAVRSALQSLGVDVKDVADADLVDKLAKNYSLHLRTADGQNLLPGAMSNYEDKLLQGIGPGLSSTQAGRMAQIEIMLEAAKSNQRLSDEANKMAQANRGILPSDWRVRRDRIMKEEMARLAEVQRGIVQRLQGAK